MGFKAGPRYRVRLNDRMQIVEYELDDRDSKRPGEFVIVLIDEERGYVFVENKK